MIRAARLNYTFASGRNGLVSVDLEAAAGEIVALVGPNGSGKTTLLRLIAGDLAPTSGSLVFDPAIPRSRVGWAYAEPVHFDELTGRENARFFAGAHHASDGAISSWLRRFDLEVDADLTVAEYSFGMQRKLLLTEALAHEPDLLLLDEPTIGLDPLATTALIETLHDRARAGTIVMLATNDVPTAMVATRIVFLHRGRKVADAAPGELLASVHEHTRIEISLATLCDRTPEFPTGIAATRSGSGYIIDAREADLLPEICRALLHAGARISSIRVRQADLTDAFRSLTGDELEPQRDA